MTLYWVAQKNCKWFSIQLFKFLVLIFAKIKKCCCYISIKNQYEISE